MYFWGFEGLNCPEYAINSIYNCFFNQGILMASPLIDLYRNVTGDELQYSLQYPRDLSGSVPDSNQSTGRGGKQHYVLFQIFETATNIEKTADQNNGTDEMGNTFGQIQASAPSSASVANAINSTASTRWNLSTKTTNVPVGQIALYIPEEVRIHQPAQYGELSVLTALNQVSGGLVGAATSYVSKNAENGAAGALLLNYVGYVFNPQEQVMFDGITFRTFSMSFTFTPFNKKEAEQVKTIIQTFRQHAAPRIVTAAGGFFFTPPSQFNISYKFKNGEDNPYINSFKRSVLEDVSVNYAPNGWSAHEDGSPVQTTLTLSFKELELVDKIDIQNGY
jgi:hypothetical protein